MSVDFTTLIQPKGPKKYFAFCATFADFNLQDFLYWCWYGRAKVMDKFFLFFCEPTNFISLREISVIKNCIFFSSSVGLGLMKVFQYANLSYYFSFFHIEWIWFFSQKKFNFYSAFVGALFSGQIVGMPQWAIFYWVHVRVSKEQVCF